MGGDEISLPRFLISKIFLWYCGRSSPRGRSFFLNGHAGKKLPLKRSLRSLAAETSLSFNF
jgi:hypothetical protein